MAIYDAKCNEVKDCTKEGLSIIYVYSKTCSQCRVLEPVINDLAKDYDQVDIYKIRSNENKAFINEYKVRAVPSILFVKDGKIEQRLMGVLNYAGIKNILEEYID